MAERAERRDRVEALETWLSRLLEDAGISVSADVVGDGWIAVESENPSIVLSTINLHSVFPLEPKARPILRTVRVTRLTATAHYIYPLEDGSTGEEEASLREWAASLGYPGKGEVREFLKSAAIVEGGPANLTLGSPSLIQARLAERLSASGLDALLLLDVAPHEVWELISSKPIGGSIASHLQLTPLAHILTLKLGVKAEKAVDNLRNALSDKNLPATLIPIPWKPEVPTH